MGFPCTIFHGSRTNASQKHPHTSHTHTRVNRSHHDILLLAFLYFFIPYLRFYTGIVYIIARACIHRRISNKRIFPGNTFVFVNFCCIHENVYIYIYTHITRIFTRTISTERKGNGPAIRKGFEKYANAYRANSYRKSTD